MTVGLTRPFLEYKLTEFWKKPEELDDDDKMKSDVEQGIYNRRVRKDKTKTQLIQDKFKKRFSK